MIESQPPASGDATRVRVRACVPVGVRVVCGALALAFASLAPRAALAAPRIVPPQQRERTDAVYPADGKGDATVVLSLLVDATGAVTDVTVREGASPFVEAALAAVKTWTFSPATRDDTPIAARISAVVTFHAPTQAPVVAEAPQPAPAAPAAPGSPAGAPPHEEVVEVAVKGEHEELGTIHIPRAETRFIPGAFGDPFRVVEALPGVAPWLSGLPYFYVRGMAPENVGYYVDGVRVPLLFHVGAGPSTIAPAMVDTVDLFPAAYPARYGRYAGAIIAGETTRPDEEHARGEVQARVFDANAFAETPIDGGKGTVLAGARYGYTGPLISLIAPDYSLAYWDYQFRASHRVAGSDQLSLFVFGAFDELRYKNSPTFRIQYHRADLRYDHPLRDGNLRIAATFNYDDTLTALQTPTGAGAQAALTAPGGRVRAEMDQHVSADAWVRAGADLNVSRFTTDNYDQIVHAPHTDVVGGAYGDVVWRPSRLVEIVPGLRVDAYRVRDQTAVAPQPRLSARIKLAPGVASITAVGVAHQEPTDEVFVPAKLPDPIAESARDSYQYSQAFELRLPSSLLFRATGFYTLLQATDIGGHQRSGGLELFLRRDFTQRLGGFVSYTLSRTETTLNGQTVRANGDRTHIVSVVLGYDLGKNWRVGGRFFFESGRRYEVTCQTPDCSPGQSPGRFDVSGDLPVFYRLDLRLEKRWLFSDGKWLAGTLECFNTLDKAEPIGVNYAPPFGLSINHQSPIILPSVGIEAGF
jgi:TonB family protein